MLSDLLISPSPTCQHGNRKLHRRQLPRNLSPVFRIMKRHPAPAKRNHTLRNPLIRLRIPVPDTSLDQPPQKPMMLNKRLQKPIHLRQLPAPEHLLLRLLLMLSVDRTHRHHTVDIRHTDRIRPLRHKQSSLPHLSTLISTHPKLFSQVPHQHTSEAHHTTLINTHPKLFSQATSAHIRSSSLKPHQHTSEAHLSSPTSAHIRCSSLTPHQHTSDALLSSPTKQSPKLRISINQSISQPIRPTIFFHNYNPKYSKNKFKYYTKTPHPIQNSLYPPIPSRQIAKNSPHPHPTQRRCHTTSQHITRKLSPCSHPAQR